MYAEMIVNAEKQSKENIAVGSGDYLGKGDKFLFGLDGKKLRDGAGKPLNDKGLLYCGKCHTLKQVRIYSRLLGNVIEPFCLCKCGDMADRKERQRVFDESRKMEIERNISGNDRIMQVSTFKADKFSNSAVSRVCRDYCRNWKEHYQPRNIGLYIYGDVGVGKTFYACCIANEIARGFGDKVKVTSINTIINEVFSTSDVSGYYRDLMNADLLVIDDFGAERKTDYGIEQVYNVVDGRYKLQKPLIITSNVDYDRITKTSDMRYKRIYDRIIEMCLPVKMEGQSKRGIFNQSVFNPDSASFDLAAYERKDIFS